MNNENFMGLGGFLWFTGVVEDRQDPLYTGRLRVRILGHHTSNKEILPTADLPWALCVLPITASGVSGIGQSATGLLEGSWVFGFFRDGTYRQEPLILGSLPGRPTQLADNRSGFYDPNEIYPKYINESDVNRLAVNLKNAEGSEINPHLSLTLRRATRIIGVPTADFNAMITADTNFTAPASDGDTWSQPNIPYNALYPYNHVYETESGHLVEYDDTPSNERIHIRHRTGSSTEYSPDGSLTNIIKSDHFTLTSGDTKVYIQGNSDTTIDGRHKIFINKDGNPNNNYDIQVGPGANVNIHVDNGDLNLHSANGRINMNAGGDYNLKVGGNMTVSVAGEFNQIVEGGSIHNTSGAVIIRGSTIDLNP
jgi:hypothetical protein